MKKEIVSKTKFTQKQAVELRDELIWQRLASISLEQAAGEFVKNFTKHTQKSYIDCFNFFFRTNILQPTMTVQNLSIMNLESIVDQIRNSVKGAEATRQNRCAAFLSFTAFLARKTSGLVRKAIPSKEKATKTFSKIRTKATSKALSEKEWLLFVAALKELNYRDYLIAKMLLQGSKRLNEVLLAKIGQIDWQKKQITFKQSKSNVLEKVTIISYPDDFLAELKAYLGNRKKGLIFITRAGKAVSQPHIFRSFNAASKKADLPFMVSAHNLRSTGVTMLLAKGFSTTDIQKISGHADSRLVSYYDKTPIENNISQKVSLI